MNDREAELTEMVKTALSGLKELEKEVSNLCYTLEFKCSSISRETGAHINDVLKKSIHEKRINILKKDKEPQILTISEYLGLKNKEE